MMRRTIKNNRGTRTAEVGPIGYTSGAPRGLSVSRRAAWLSLECFSRPGPAGPKHDLARNDPVRCCVRRSDTARHRCFKLLCSARRGRKSPYPAATNPLCSSPPCGPANRPASCRPNPRRSPGERHAHACRGAGQTARKPCREASHAITCLSLAQSSSGPTVNIERRCDRAGCGACGVRSAEWRKGRGPPPASSASPAPSNGCANSVPARRQRPRPRLASTSPPPYADT
jgi:hypothetical protein